MPEAITRTNSRSAAAAAVMAAVVVMVAIGGVALVDATAALLLGLGAGVGAVVGFALARRGAPARGAAEEDGQSLAGRVARLESEVGRLRDVLEAIDEPVLATGSEGVVVACNTAAVSLLGVRSGGLLGRRVDELFTQEDLLDLHSAAASGRAGRRSLQIARGEGVRLFEVAAAPVGEQAGGGGPASPRPVVMTFHDVTEAARSLRVRTDFVANASHELRTPVAALKIAAETLTGEASDDPAMRERLVRMISSNIARLDEMVRDLLDLSRLESPDAGVKVEPVRGSELARELGPLFESVLAERGLSLRFDLAPELEGLETDRNLVSIILQNLIENATKFANEGTEVVVTGRPVPPGAGKGTEARRGVRFEVIDRGIGIPLDQQGRIFERYYQVDPARTGGVRRRGSGLGLAIVKHAARTLGGTVRVQSVWKQGTTMTVELPGCLPPEAGRGGAG